MELTLPAASQQLADTLRTSLAQVLMSRDGAALKPGTRAYARSWIRDGAMMVGGLVRMGEVNVARRFVDWFAGYVFHSGKVPCCVDARGADPVLENDSDGQYLHAVAEVWRHSGDATAGRTHGTVGRGRACPSRRSGSSPSAASAHEGAGSWSWSWPSSCWPRSPRRRGRRRSSSPWVRSWRSPLPS